MSNNTKVNYHHNFDHSEELTPDKMPTSLFSQVKMAMSPEEFAALTNPPSDADLNGVEGDGPGMQSPASAPEEASLPFDDSDFRESMDPEMVRQDLRELLRQNEVKRKSLQEKFVEENLATNRGNL